MKKYLLLVFVIFLAVTSLFAQHSYYYSRQDTLPPINLTANTVDLQYPVNMYNVKAVGMGNTQIALGKNFNAMLYNPAFLGRSKKSFEILGLGGSMPPATYEAAKYLADNMDEFIEATSLTQVYDGIDAFFAEGATVQQRLDAIHQIQDGMKFTVDLVEKVTGPPDDPLVHGVSVIPSIQAQYGNFGFSLYGFGYSGFVVQLSPTLEFLSNVTIPTNPKNPILAAKSLAQILGALTTVTLGPGEGFAKEVHPMAFYMSYIDIVSALGYGFQWKDNWLFGANLKVVNRRFSTDRVPVMNYDQILDEALSVLETEIYGVTADVGCAYQTPFGTNFGLSLQNIFPIKSIEQTIHTDFRTPKIYYDRDAQGQIITNADGDTALVSAYRYISVDRPFKLKSPFIASIGVSHPITKNWDVALDWVDLFENDSRYDHTTERIRLGSEYRINFWKHDFQFALRGGYADENFCFGLGLNFGKYFQIDGAYAYDRIVDTYSYFAQAKIGW
ncbi:MAG: hypothetical protein GXO74_16545 [Calditrichaeota bacterium]|nr:hypothetical protein [Calditrichota bacterium]